MATTAILNNAQVIFQIRSADNRWLDYCREQPPSPDLNDINRWAKARCDKLERNVPGWPTRYIVEDWP